ncbi:MAG: EamA family transporter, partial [Rhodoferax sp.]|nr:EamA family transporter [Rhodoferax sp.]
MRDDASRGLLLVAGATFFWSLSGVFARWLPQVDPWTFNATRGLGMGVALLLWMAWEYRLGAIRLFLQSDPAA